MAEGTNRRDVVSKTEIRNSNITTPCDVRVGQCTRESVCDVRTGRRRRTLLHTQQIGTHVICTRGKLGAVRIENRKDILAVDAVTCEPVSGSKFPLTGKNTGNFAPPSGSIASIRWEKHGVNGFRPEIGTGNEQGNNRRHNRENASRNRKSTNARFCSGASRTALLISHVQALRVGPG